MQSTGCWRVGAPGSWGGDKGAFAAANATFDPEAYWVVNIAFNGINYTALDGWCIDIERNLLPGHYFADSL